MTMKITTAEINGQRGFITQQGGFCTWGDGFTGTVTYDTDILRMLTDEREEDRTVFDRIPITLVLPDGTPVDDDQIEPDA